MAKAKTIYVCQDCGSISPKWQGKCNSCNNWNTLVEEIEVKKGNKVIAKSKSTQKVTSIQDVEVSTTGRIPLPDEELNRVLGSGMVPGCIVLLAGEPGIGKSTLLLQAALNHKGKVLYISGEESPSQIKIRANRITGDNTELLIGAETTVEWIIAQMEHHQPDWVVIDSIQTIHTQNLESAPGTVGQIRESSHLLIQQAKNLNIPLFIIGHITKEGSIAGPKLLEHMVDTVLQFEGDTKHLYRMVRTSKNRFGATSEVGIYEMRNEGLLPVKNPSSILLSAHHEPLPGVAIGASLEGIRPMLIEVQALVTKAVYGTPQRSATGFDLRRLNMLLAVLEKRGGFNFGTQDVFLNITGGMKVNDPAIDLAICMALISSYVDRALPKQVVFSAEVGLSGELRPVRKVEQRISESAKLGFKGFVRATEKGDIQVKGKIKTIAFSKLEQCFKTMFKSEE